ncbi:MAG TPA: A/G-specific adenine glycosylase [Chthonomonadaceae bacterium]|nr:A/G-specific adenine glycosylase [Chthonomonadaceae bacterium]
MSTRQASCLAPIMAAELVHDTRDIAAPLVAWYRAHKRDLPWRVGSPYAVWISEIMLQQTQVATVVPYFLRFMERFPSVEALAAAPIDDVLRHWAGLGYYARARNLHRAAQIVAAEHGGRVPDTAAAIRALPGIGRYTAGAILSIAYGVPLPLVDGNVVRVLSRLTGMRGDPKSAANQAALWTLAERLVPAVRPCDFNQGLMELGALVCRPDEPLCEQCPLLPHCVAGNSPDPTAYPEIPPGRTTIPVSHASAIVVAAGSRLQVAGQCEAGAAAGSRLQVAGQCEAGAASGSRLQVAGECDVVPAGNQEPGTRNHEPATSYQLLLTRRPAHGLWGGLWEFPRVICDKGEDPAAAAGRAAREAAGVEVEVGERVALIKHSVTHHKITLHGFLARLEPPDQEPRPAGCAEARWVPLTDLEGYAMAAPQALLRAAVKEQLAGEHRGSAQPSLEL